MENKTIKLTIQSAKEDRQKAGLLTIAEAADELGVYRNELWYRQRIGDCKRPEYRVEGRTRLYYHKDDLPELQSYFSKK
ncbi:hypothetical protein [Thalassoroseus pseudoceratinae]|uniref:hypothetical protein n=1 Tax=Thalassoroseus pseudoceratinae TaxID=2713176 RepID=UPI00142184DF|nr:hypothetical protein [Thalassoroseus pseudoceratinae]